MAGKFHNYCYLLVIASNSTTIDISQDLYCNAYLRTRLSSKVTVVAMMTGNALPMMPVAVTDWFSLHNNIRIWSIR